MRLYAFVSLLALPALAVAGAPQTVVLDVQNMTCELCPITVRKALEKVPGVSDAKIEPGKKTATVSVMKIVFGQLIMPPRYS